MYSLSGMCVSEGAAQGRALQIRRPSDFSVKTKTGRLEPEAEIFSFEKACREFVARLYQVIQGQAPDSVRDLFGAVAGFISSPDNQREIRELIKSGKTAHEACALVLPEHLKAFARSDDVEIKAQARELNALAREFISTLDQGSGSSFELPVLTEPTVIIAQDLTPAHFLCLRTEFVRAVVLEGGLSSGHLGVVLRELRIPALFSVIGASSIKNGEKVLVDAGSSSLIVEPSEAASAQLMQDRALFTEDVSDDLICNVTVACSVGADRELDGNQAAVRHGLGLLRSEFLFLGSDHEPDEIEMIMRFGSIFSKIPDNAPISARTFDFAGDKKPIFTLNLDDRGPLHGYGASVGTALLKKELRAMLQAAPQRSLNIVFPLISRVSEAKYLNDLLTAVIDELTAEEKPISPCTASLMIETPAAVFSARAFAPLASRFIIGTSSLAEYASAPREPDAVFTPVLAKMIALACRGAHEAGIKVGVAGRFAARIELLPFFLSLGADYITVDSYSIAKVIAELERLDTDKHAPHFDAQLYDAVMELATGRDITALINNLNFRG